MAKYSETDWDDIDLTWEIPEAEAGTRIDKFLSEMIGESLSRSQIQQWIKRGHVRVQDRLVKPNYRLAAGEVLEIELPEPQPSTWNSEQIPLDVVYEDEALIIVNKPRGMVVHPAPGHPSGTLVNGILHKYPDNSRLNGAFRFGIVHRIDKDTSGILMIARTEQSHASLTHQLKLHQVERKYFALVHGEVQHNQGTIDAPIGRDIRDRKRFKVTDLNGKHAVTHFHVIERFEGYTLLQLQLVTGRTHQIRVHLKFIGLPIVGDPIYGRKDKLLRIGGQALHAAELGLKHPETKKMVKFTAPMPEDMEQLLQQLRERMLH